MLSLPGAVCIKTVLKPTHGNNIFDTFSTSSPYISEVEVFASLIKTKHRAVVVKQTLSPNNVLNRNVRKKV